MEEESEIEEGLTRKVDGKLNFEKWMEVWLKRAEFYKQYMMRLD